MGDLMHPSVDSAMLGKQCSETRGVRRVETVVHLARTEPFPFVIAVNLHDTTSVDKSVGCEGKLYVNR